VALLADDEPGDWPQWRYDEVTGEEEEIDLFAEVVAHLQEGSVAVFLEVGAQKLRRLSGHAVAVNARGEVAEVSLQDIYTKAASLGQEVTPAED
jgi:hypothetical protein